VSNANRHQKSIRRDQTGPRETREELLEEIRDGSPQPRVENPNRDRSRGDWDRTGKHHDENA
jgi:hypothetical protein